MARSHQLTANDLDGVEVRALCRQVKFFNRKLLFQDSLEALSCWKGEQDMAHKNHAVKNLEHLCQMFILTATYKKI